MGFLSQRPATRDKCNGLSLVEMLVVLSIVAAVAGLITFAINRTLRQQRQKVCLTNMMMIEAVKDEYARDHVGQPIDTAEFARYFKFKIPRCPDNSGEDYQNLFDLSQPASCRVHPENSDLLKKGS
jgi:prepilin-type N-terminal cleavage/methylation domain-containing protein